MNANHLESRLPPIDSNLNRLGVDEDNIRHLKAVFVKDMLERRTGSKRDIETACSLSPDVALLMLRRQHEWEAHVLEYIGNAEKAMEGLAFKLDADGSIAEQCSSDARNAEWFASIERAMDVLRRKTNDCGWTRHDQETTATLQFLRNVYERNGLGSENTDRGSNLPFE
jgi:hypothetical protein